MLPTYKDMLSALAQAALLTTPNLSADTVALMQRLIDLCASTSKSEQWDAAGNQLFDAAKQTSSHATVQQLILYASICRAIGVAIAHFEMSQHQQTPHC
jgi:hypothetical protein